MEYIKLCEVISSAKTERCGASDYPVLSITKSDGVVLQSDKFKKRIASTDTEQYKLVKRGQLVQGIHIDEANFGIQSIVDIGIVSPAYKIWNVDFQKIVPKYLETVLRSPRSVRYYSSKFNGSVKRRERITDSDFLAMEIPFPSKEQQQYAVDVLEKACSMTTLYQQQLQKLDELVKARFVEMFGDPLDGTAKYPIHQVGDVADSVDPQPSHRTPPIDDNGIPYVSTKDCDYKTGKINFEGARKVSRKVLEEHLNRYTLHDGDFIIGKIGTIGNPVFVPARDDYTLSANVVLVQPNSNLVSPYFLKYSFESDFVENQFAEAKNSTSQAAFGIQKVRTVKVMNPDLSIQMGFENFVKQTDKSKVAVQKALDEAQLLFDSLMQKYFG